MSDANPYLDTEDAAPVTATAGGNPYLDEAADENPYLETTMSERAANAAKAGAQGLVTSVGESISGAARTKDTIRMGGELVADTIREDSMLTRVPAGSAKPTMRQERRAFVQGMEDPRYMAALTEAGDDPALMLRAEQFFGPKAKLDAIRTPIDESHKMSAAERSAQLKRLGMQPTAAAESTAQQKRLELDSPTYQFGKGLVAAGREVYETNPYLDTKPESQLARAVGSTAPSAALSLVPVVGTSAAVTQYALSQSESMAQEAIDAGRPDLALQSATAGLFIGALSEGTLGATARLGSLLKNPTRIAALEGWAKANPIKATMLISGIREAAQEGAEQGLQNVTASDVVGYEPERPWHRQVLESMVLGGAAGALFGGSGALLHRSTQPKAVAVSDSPEEAAAVAELNAALDAFQTEPEPAAVQTPGPTATGRIEELAVAAPAVQGPQGETIPLPPAEEKLTAAQVMSREAVNAMAELRALKAKAAEQVGKRESEKVGEVAQVETPAAVEPVEPVTVERPTSNAELSTEPATTNLQPVTAAAPAARRKFTLGERADGISDVLDAISDLGGIKAPGSQKGTAEYDGYAAAFNERGPAAVLRGGSNRPDLLLQQLQAQGFNFETIDEMYEAVSRANASRDALTAQVKAERTVRPQMVERVQSLYDAAAAGAPVTSEQLAELEGSLSQKELKTLKGPLEKLRSLADVALPVAGELSPIARAKADVRKAWGDLQTLGIMPDPKRDAEKTFALYKALLRLAVEYTRKGGKSVAEFAAKHGLKLNAVVQAAWDDAAAGKPKTSALQLEPSAVAELVEGMRERKFSKRFADDDRIDPAIREATGNSLYQPVPNELTVTQALSQIQEHGLDDAIARMKDERNRDISDRERVALGQAIVTKLNHEYAQTKSEAALDKAVDVAEWLTEYGTRLGQGVQAFAIWSRLTPEGYVRAYVNAVKVSNKINKPKVPATVDKVTAAKIRSDADAALKKPAGFQRDEDLIDVLAQIAKAKGVSKMDIALGLWYANILSGWTTQVRNMAGNVSNLFAESFTHAAARPQHLPAILAGLYNGALRGALDAAPVLRTGKITGTRLGKVEAPAALELVKFKGLAYPLNAWKYVFRVMAATDMVGFRSAEEMRARFLAREIVRKEKLSGPALAKRMAELLHNTPALRAQAEAQAAKEGLTGMSRSRRVAELVEQGRPQDLVQSAADYGRFATFNQDPEGVLGVLSTAIAGASQRFAPLRLVVPFTRVVANVTNNGLNFTPWGYRRLFPSAFMDENWMKADAAPLDYQLQTARATLGTLALGALYALAVQYRDDDDPAFMLTANGPQDPEQRKQLRETGWEPYSVKIGDRYWSYRETPLHLVMATLGSLLDAGRYKKLDEADSMTRYAYALRQIGTAPLNQSFLRSLSEFFEGLSDDRVPRSGAKFGGLSRTASSLVIPNLVKQVDRLFDPTVYDAGTVQGALMRDIPVARGSLPAAMNVLGEPIKADQNPFYSLDRPDPLWQVIGRRQLWIPVPSRTMMVGDRPITPEEYRDFTEARGNWLSRQLRRPETLHLLATRSTEQAQTYVDRYSDAATQVARAKLRLRPAMPKR